MLKNYLKIAFRNFIKQKGFSLINILGLAIGFTSCILILLYILQETDYDTFHENKDNIYRVTSHSKSPTGIRETAGTPWPVAPHLAMEFPEIEKVTRLYVRDNDLFEYEDKQFNEDRLAFVDSTFFEVFSFKVLSGNPGTMLNAPFSIVFTKSMAEKYFGDENPIGKQIKIENKQFFTITGVIEDIPVNSHFHFDFAASYSSLTPEFFGWDPSAQWGAYYGNVTYILLNKNSTIGELKEKTKDWFNEKMAAYKTDMFSWIGFEPLKNIHLKSTLEGQVEPVNSVKNLITLGIIGLFILLTACINFVNLSTSRAARRAREVGVRKTLGALRFQLMKQFTGEALLISLFALLLALVLVELLLPLFSNLLNAKIENGIFSSPLLLPVVFISALLIGMMAGFYPAFVLSRYKAALVIKGGSFTESISSGSFLRKILIVMQFSIAIFFIAATIIINSQIDYVKNANLGFQKEHIIGITLNDPKVDESIEAVKSEILNIPGVISATSCTRAPIGTNTVAGNIFPNGEDKTGSFNFYLYSADTSYLSHFGLQLIAGKSYTRTEYTGYVPFVINETTVKKLGFASPQEAIGKRYPLSINNIKGEVIGVVKDFHNNSMHSPISAAIIMPLKYFRFELSVKIASSDVSGTISKMKSIWEKFSSGFPFTYNFLDEEIDNMYKAEEQQATFVETFSILAIFIACLGLLGLASYTVQQRTKEIGIRKVFGASIKGITFMLSKDFLKLVLISGIIASPVAYYFMEKWLEDFAFKIDLTVTLFLLATAIALAIAIITIGYHSIRASLSNPVESLKYE